MPLPASAYPTVTRSADAGASRTSNSSAASAPAPPSTTLVPPAASVGPCGRYRPPSTFRDGPPSAAPCATSAATVPSCVVTRPPFSFSPFAGTPTPSPSKSSACTRYSNCSRRLSGEATSPARRVVAPTVSSTYGLPPATSAAIGCVNTTRTRTASPK